MRFIFTCILTLVTLLNTPLVMASSHKPLRFGIYRPGSYAYSEFYELKNLTFSSKLVVEMIYEFNEPNGRCREEIWFPHTHVMNLQFTIGGLPQRVKIYPIPQGVKLHHPSLVKKHQKYGIHGLESIQDSMWYPAVKRLAEGLGRIHYGKQSLGREFYAVAFNQLSIKYLRNRQLKTADSIRLHPLPADLRTMRVNVDVQLEVDHHGKEMLVAMASFDDKSLRAPKEDYTVIKFGLIKKRLKVLSKSGAKRSSKWDLCAKKIARRSVNRYFKFKHRQAQVVDFLK